MHPPRPLNLIILLVTIPQTDIYATFLNAV
jgi:hypothetical protein